jgi:solute carrier family 25 phosphate transporter 3
MSAQAPASSTGSVKLDAIKATAAAANPNAPKGLDLYSRFAFAGAVCCAVTHGGFTPVDVYVLLLPTRSHTIANGPR